LDKENYIVHEKVNNFYNSPGIIMTMEWRRVEVACV